MLPECSGRLNINMLGNVALVLDATESAWKYQGAVLDLALKAIEKLPAGLGKNLYFLGNSNAYNCTELARKGAAWWNENRERGSFITPIARRERGNKILVIGSGPIYDLDDWKDDIGHNLVMANVGEGSPGGVTGALTELERPDISELLPLVHDPILTAEISGDGFMPFYWDNPEYSLSVGESAVLRASHPQDATVNVAYWGNNVKAILSGNQSRQEIPLEFTELPPVKGWMGLEKSEAAVFFEACQGRDFACPVCGGRHTATTLRCYETSAILGEPVYRSLAGRHGFVIFRDDGKTVEYRFHHVSSLKVGEHEVAIARGGAAEVYGLEPPRKWVARGEMEPYRRFRKEYILVL